MFNKLLILSVLSLCGLSLSAPAQRIGFQYGNKGLYISASADLGHGYRKSGRFHRAPRGRYRGKSARKYRRGYRNRGRAWVPGHYERVYVPARYRWVVDECGYRQRVLVRRACYERQWVRGYYR
jgi:hypothetical protein